MGTVEFVRGGTSGIASKALKDGQILFDKDNRTISLDAMVNGTLTRLVMAERTFNGTAEQWAALSDAQKAVFTYVNITDDYEGNIDTMTGATASANGAPGYVPTPLAGDENKVLKGNASWATLEDVAWSGDADDLAYDNTDSGLTATNAQDAIDEIVDEIGGIEEIIPDTATSSNKLATMADIGGGSASDITYDNTTSGLTADDVQDAIDEVVSGLGTAAALDAPASGNAGSTEVVLGNDSRLTDSRNAADVYDWAKAATKPTYTASEVGLGSVGNFKAVSTEASQGLTSTEQANARTNIGAGTSDFDGAYSSLAGAPTLGTAASKDVAATGDASSTEVVMGNDSRLTDSRPASDVSSWAKESTKPTYTASEVGAVASTLVGVASGVAELDSNGKVPSSQLPSYVDDVIEGYYDTLSEKFYEESTYTTEITGETGKIYVDLSTNKTYRWSGSAFTVIGTSLALGETSSTAYRGDRGKTAYDHSQTTSGNPHNVTASDVGLGNVGNFKAVSTEASQGLTSTEQANARANIGAGTSSFDGAYSSLSGAPTLGTASEKDVATSGDASSTQVVMGNDSRLTDARNAADVYSWAKAETKPTYTASEVGLGDVGNFKAVSTVASQGLTDTEKSNARANIGVIDFDVSSPSGGQTLSYNATSGKWENADSSAGTNNFVGTLAQWNALTDSQKAEYDTYDITDDFNGIPVDDSPTASSNNPVKSGGVYSALSNKQNKINSETQSGTLAISATSITLNFSTETIGATTMIDIYTSAFGVNPTAVTWTSSSITLTFDAQQSAVTVTVKITN